MSIKILLASGSRHSIPPLQHSPGVARVIYTLSQALKKEGYDIQVISQYHPDLSSLSYDRKVYRHPKPNWITGMQQAWLKCLPYRWLKKRYGFTQIDRILYYKGVVKEASKIKPDLVISFMHIELFKQLHQHIPQAQHIYFFRSTDLAKRIGKANMSYLLKNSAGFLANTQAPIQELKFFGDFDFPAKTIYNAVLHPRPDKEEIKLARQEIRMQNNIDADAVVLGFAGRFSEEKSLLELFQAVAELNQAGANYHILLAGDIRNEKTPNWPYYQKLKSFEQQQLKGKVHWQGWVTHHKLWEFYAAIDFGLVLSKYSEGNSMFLLESLFYGKPVIATRIGGNAEVIRTGYNGFLVHPKKIQDELEQVLYRLQQESSGYEILVENAKNYITQHHAPAIMIQQFKEYLQNFN
ncbi:glycosyltransferase family 4 protein [Mesonia sp. HuA40]|uniref:glycosyltransferase family 4 protein n=1 Tax=Mesonia sp. HuA40 TaxID=2602761 RepID=UPI0011C9E5FC|nr:glycosyltransferase family 4 protein [Mesonia sp. HuA40]TXK71930.1 glycosyltransferase family 4 protein [Mesonia sp. HuA40]